MKIITIILSYVLVSNVFCAEKGDSCEIDFVTSGKCELLYDCVEALTGLKNGIMPKTCGFEGTTPIVCCPNNLARINKSAAKCSEYAQLSLQPRSKSEEVKHFSAASIGGQPSMAREFPHMAALGFGEKASPKWLCGGSLISNQYILTAAHCLHSREYGDVQWVRLGDLNLYTSVDDASPEDFHIAEKIKHPGYLPTARYHDIALLKLDREVKFNFYISPACLHTKFVINDTSLVATGWGLTEPFGEPSEHLIKVDLDLFSDELCRTMYSPVRTLQQGIVSNYQFCAGTNTTVNALERGTCSGDSGGPLQIRNGLSYMYNIVGITSFGRGSCGSINNAGVYTRVSHYVPWIESIIWP